MHFNPKCAWFILQWRHHIPCLYLIAPPRELYIHRQVSEFRSLFRDRCVQDIMIKWVRRCVLGYVRDFSIEATYGVLHVGLESKKKRGKSLQHKSIVLSGFLRVSTGFSSFCGFAVLRSILVAAANTVGSDQTQHHWLQQCSVLALGASLT